MEKRDQAVFDEWYAVAVAGPWLGLKLRRRRKGMIEVEDSGSAIKTEEQLQQEAEELIATLKRDKVVLLEVAVIVCQGLPPLNQPLAGRSRWPCSGTCPARRWWRGSPRWRSRAAFRVSLTSGEPLILRRCCSVSQNPPTTPQKKRRGNYIYVTDEELDAISKWVQRKGAWSVGRGRGAASSRWGGARAREAGRAGRALQHAGPPLRQPLTMIGHGWRCDGDDGAQARSRSTMLFLPRLAHLGLQRAVLVFQRLHLFLQVGVVALHGLPPQPCDAPAPPPSRNKGAPPASSPAPLWRPAAPPAPRRLGQRCAASVRRSSSDKSANPSWRRPS